MKESRKQIIKNKFTMTRTVILPSEINKRLDKLATLKEEVNGILLYRSQREYCPIEQSFMLGVGSAGHVQAQLERLEVANEFLRRNRNYNFVRFHTHSRGTIENFGNYYAKYFSAQDISEIKKEIMRNPDHIEMLVTPETKLLSGIDNPHLIIVDDFPGFHNRSRAVRESLQIIERNLGYDLSKLSATQL